MSKGILVLIGLVLLSGPLGAQGAVLYNNPYNGSGSGDCTFTDACSVNFSGQLAQSFTLTNAAIVQSVSFVVADPYVPLTYAWSMFTTGANGLPTGAPGPISWQNNEPIPLPFASAGGLTQGYIGLGTGPGTYTYQTLAANTGTGLCCTINEVTINTGPIKLAAGTYDFALLANGSEIDYEGWAPGTATTGAASAFLNVWSPATQEGSLALTVNGTLAPEIDPASAMGGLTLLLGGLLVLRGRGARLSYRRSQAELVIFRAAAVPEQLP